MNCHLLDAVKRSDVKMVNCLVALGADVNAPCKLTLPLVIAADGRNTRMCLALVNHGASLHEVVSNPSSPCFGHSPLSLAVCSGLTNAVSYLVMFGADINVEIDWSICVYNPLHVSPGSSLLHAAVARGDRVIIDSLLQAGCSLNKVSTKGDTPLLLACRRSDPDVAKHLLVATKACKEKLNPDAMNTLTGQTSLLEAVARNDTSLARHLLDAGCDVNLHTYGGMTALHYAVTLRRELMLSGVLLSVKGCDVNVRDDAGLTPLHVAATYRDPLFAELLLDAGANCNRSSLDGQSPLHFAAKGGHCCMIELLVGRGKDSALVCSIYRRSEDISALLVASGASTILSHSSPVSPIHMMIVSEQRRTLELLVAAGFSYTRQDIVVASASDESDKIVSWLHSLLETPKSLKELSRVVVRTTLSEHAQGRTIVPLVELLDLPAVLLKYLLLGVDNLCLVDTLQC
ncbi:hypothetical protein NP493_3863g00004 [Ridgeia piscesae]|uniref:SOCS box domain-containing protein n=1 Tax=Ridgeia piscesae TaxID=27915 RepID=A0AAD9J4J3_RIDPI|nr:hypothetical protein NP493_3863g00004 [Ridgeia piscesae]